MTNATQEKAWLLQEVADIQTGLNEIRSDFMRDIRREFSLLRITADRTRRGAATAADHRRTPRHFAEISKLATVFNEKTQAFRAAGYYAAPFTHSEIAAIGKTLHVECAPETTTPTALG